MLSFLFGPRGDEFEASLRRASSRLGVYASELRREAASADAAVASRARELSAARAQSVTRLAFAVARGRDALLPDFFAQSALRVRRAYVRAAMDAAASACFRERAAAAEAWRRHLGGLAADRAAEGARGARGGGNFESAAHADASLPLDVPSFCAPLKAVLDAYPPLARLRARDAALTVALRAADERVRIAAPVLALAPAPSRAAALAAVCAGESASKVTEEAARVAWSAAMTSAGVLASAAAVFAYDAAVAHAEFFFLEKGSGDDFDSSVSGSDPVRRPSVDCDGLTALKAFLLFGWLRGGGGAVSSSRALGGAQEATAGVSSTNAARSVFVPAKVAEAVAAAWDSVGGGAARARADAAVKAAADLIRGGAARARARTNRLAMATSHLADTRTKEGRLLQAWAQRVLVGPNAGPAGAVYAFGLPRYTAAPGGCVYGDLAIETNAIFTVSRSHPDNQATPPPFSLI